MLCAHALDLHVALSILRAAGRAASWQRKSKEKERRVRVSTSQAQALVPRYRGARFFLIIFFTCHFFPFRIDAGCILSSLRGSLYSLYAVGSMREYPSPLSVLCRQVVKEEIEAAL